MTISVTEYLLIRLNELGVDTVFGVPGDYNLSLLDPIVNSKDLQWIGNCNELNSAYAADGYARIKGIGALITTFGVGELSAINGIAGAFAEHVPVVNIVGMPALFLQNKKLFLHHNLTQDNFLNFLNMHVPVTAAQGMLNQQHPGAEIDRLLTVCWREKQPVYIGIPADIAGMQIEPPPQSLDVSGCKTDPDALNEAVEHIVSLLQAAKNPVVVIDAYPERFQAMPLVKEFINTTQLPFVTTPMGKALMDETHPNFLGMYIGNLSAEPILQQVESSDCLIYFGWIRSDVNTGLFTSSYNSNHSIDIQKSSVRVRNSHYLNVDMNAVISLLIERVKPKHNQIPSQLPKSAEPYIPTENNLTIERLWQRLHLFFQEEDVILAEVGTSLYGLLETQLPKNVKVISQIIWSSIGYTLGALLGAMVARSTSTAHFSYRGWVATSYRARTLYYA
ncbi:MAG: alpha-keto acid decarboxylase family protein, partial [Gammaproteobacteria bacterium]